HELGDGAHATSGRTLSSLRRSANQNGKHVGVVPIALYQVVRRIADDISEGRETLNQNGDRIALAVRRDRLDDFACEPLVCGLVHLWPRGFGLSSACRRSRARRRRAGCAAFAPWGHPPMLLCMVKQCADPDAIAPE